jgi:glucose/arabinose dehydrogenase
MRASYALPGGVGAASLAFHPGTGVPTFAGNLFIAARAGYLLRVEFDESNASRAMRSEKLLEGKVAELRGVAVAPDGAIYVATPTSVWRLAVAR